MRRVKTPFVGNCADSSGRFGGRNQYVSIRLSGHAIFRGARYCFIALRLVAALNGIFGKRESGLGKLKAPAWLESFILTTMKHVA